MKRFQITIFITLIFLKQNIILTNYEVLLIFIEEKFKFKTF